MLVAVSKTVGLAEVEQAIQAGINDFGENRSQLFTQKQEAFAHARWHFIGHIQTNKLKDVVGKAALIHSVTSQHALAVISRLALEQQIKQDILIEVNVSGEASKDGISAAELPRLLEAAANTQAVEVKGLMCMAPVLQSAQDLSARRSFAALRELRDNLVAVFAGVENISLNELSMGMSDDFADAIMEGSTIVRIGRRLWSL